MQTFGILEPDVESTLAALRTAGRRPFEQLGVEGARDAYRAGRNTTQLLPLPMASVLDIDIGSKASLPARVYRPDVTAGQTQAPAILFFHGGGWVIGDLDTHDSICRALSAGAGRTVIAVHYRRAPEHRFPAALDDALEAFAQVMALAGHLCIDPYNIALAGDSAGGTLATVVAYHAMQGGRESPSCATSVLSSHGSARPHGLLPPCCRRAHHRRNHALVPRPLSWQPRRCHGLARISSSGAKSGKIPSYIHHGRRA